jgi:hypothetical protein
VDASRTLLPKKIINTRTTNAMRSILDIEFPSAIENLFIKLVETIRMNVATCSASQTFDVELKKEILHDSVAARVSHD